MGAARTERENSITCACEVARPRERDCGNRAWRATRNAAAARRDGSSSGGTPRGFHSRLGSPASPPAPSPPQAPRLFSGPAARLRFCLATPHGLLSRPTFSDPPFSVIMARVGVPKDIAAVSLPNQGSVKVSCAAEQWGDGRATRRGGHHSGAMAAPAATPPHHRRARLRSTRATGRVRREWSRQGWVVGSDGQHGRGMGRHEGRAVGVVDGAQQV